MVPRLVVAVQPVGGRRFVVGVGVGGCCGVGVRGVVAGGRGGGGRWRAVVVAAVAAVAGGGVGVVPVVGSEVFSGCLVPPRRAPRRDA